MISSGVSPFRDFHHIFAQFRHWVLTNILYGQPGMAVEFNVFPIRNFAGLQYCNSDVCLHARSLSRISATRDLLAGLRPRFCGAEVVTATKSFPFPCTLHTYPARVWPDSSMCYTRTPDHRRNASKLTSLFEAAALAEAVRVERKLPAPPNRGSPDSEMNSMPREPVPPVPLSLCPSAPALSLSSAFIRHTVRTQFLCGFRAFSILQTDGFLTEGESSESPVSM